MSSGDTHLCDPEGPPPAIGFTLGDIIPSTTDQVRVRGGLMTAHELDIPHYRTQHKIQLPIAGSPSSLYVPGIGKGTFYISEPGP